MLNAHSKLISIPYNHDILSVKALCLVFFFRLLPPILDRIGLDPILDRGISASVFLCRGESTKPAVVWQSNVRRSQHSKQIGPPCQTTQHVIISLYSLVISSVALFSNLLWDIIYNHVGICTPARTREWRVWEKSVNQILSPLVLHQMLSGYGMQKLPRQAKYAEYVDLLIRHFVKNQVQKLVLYYALTVHSCLCQSKRFVERLCKVWWLSRVQQIEGGHLTKVWRRIRHVRSFGHTSVQSDPIQYKSTTQLYIWRTHKPKILNQNFVKQPALGSLSSFSGKYRFLNLDLQALVKEPALSDGRLQPGDKLLAANGVELASFSHQEVIILMVLLMMVMMMVNHHWWYR